MFAPLLACVGILAAEPPAPPAIDPPCSWSPSGEWLAFATASPTGWQALEAIRILPDPPGGRPAPDATVGEWAHRIWAVRVDDGRAVEVAAGPGPMTSPAWGPDGRSLAFARVVPAEAGGGPAWEVVVAFGPEQDVVDRRPLTPDEAEALARRWPGEAVAWDPEGRLLAVPGPGTLGVSLVDPGRREVVRSIPDARLPSFSPSGGRLAYFRPRGALWELVEARTDAESAEARPIDLVADPVQAPAWTSDGRAILYLKREPPTVEGEQTALYLARVDREGPPSKIKDVEPAIMPGQAPLGAYLAVAADGIDQFFAVLCTGRASALSYHRGDNILDRIHPFSGLGALGAPALSPDGSKVAVRFGGPGPGSVVGVLDLRSKELTPLTPGLDEKAAWVAALAVAADLPENPQARPTRLPFASDLDQPGQFPSMYRRLAKLGSRLTDDLVRARGSGPATSRAALVFSYLGGDYRAAESALSALEPMPSASADESLRLLGLKAQIRLARGEAAEALEMIEFVRRSQRDRVARVEPDGGGGFVVSSEPPEEHSWVEALWRLHQEQAGDAGKPDPATPPPDTIPPSPFERPPTIDTETPIPGPIP